MPVELDAGFARYRLDGQRLVIDRKDKPRRSVSLAEVTSVRLWAYRNIGYCYLEVRDAPRAAIVGPPQAAAAYRAFVRALHQSLVTRSAVTYVAGYSAFFYAGLFVLLGAAAVVAIVFASGVAASNALIAAGMGLLIGLPLVSKGPARPYLPTSPPEKHLPHVVRTPG